jgi:hypothetical protein
MPSIRRGLSGRRRRAYALASVRRPNRACSFPAHGFHEDTGLQDATKRATNKWALPFTRPVGSGLQYPRTMMYGFFAKRTDPPHHPYSADYPSLPSCLRLPPSPTHSSRRSLGHAAFAALKVLFGSPTTDRASLATSLPLIGSLTPVLSGDSASSPEVTRCSSVPCHPQSPWCGG